MPIPLPDLLDTYIRLLDANLVLATLPQLADEPPARIAVERGLAWPLLAGSPTSTAAFALIAPLLNVAFDLDAATVVDAGGHVRPAYRGLLCYAAFHAIAASDRVLLNDQAAAVLRWVETLRDEVQSAGLAPPDLPAAFRGEAAGVAWSALAVYRGGELLHDDRLIDWAGQVFHGLIACQRADGPYLLPSRSDNPEILWYHELQILHAIGSYALQTGDEAALASARRAAAYHLNETQPDHATNEPWGLPAFLCDPQTHLMADQLLHTAAVQQPGRAGGVTLILLADTLYSLRRHRSR
jgi:hypothetical protein